MQVPLFANVLWAVGAALKVLLCVLVFYRHLYRRLRLFTVYVVLLSVKDAVVWWAYHEWGYTSRPAWYVYWVASGVVLLARGLVVAELCWAGLRNYPALWPVLRKILALIAFVLLTCAGVAAARSSYRIVAFVLTTERGLELAASVILVTLFAVSVRYRAWLEPLERNIVLGLAMYSTLQMLNNIFMTPRMTPYFPWWESVRVGCFDIVMAMWVIPLLKPLPASSPPQPLISEQASLYLLRQLLDRMQALAHELKRVGKAIRK